MFHVHILCEPYGAAPGPATFVRSLLPLTHPVNAAAVAVTFGSAYRRADLLIVERAWAADLDVAEDLVARARLDRCPVVYATDDNLLDLDPATTRGYLSAAQKPGIECLARAACGVVVSTEPLRARMAGYNRHTVVLPNAVDERLFAGRPAARPAGRPPVIGYMGTATHDADLAAVAAALRDVLDEFGGTFEIVGGVAHAATLGPLLGRPVRVVQTGDCTAYPDFMRGLAANACWDVAIAPLRDTPFNRCKSDLKFIDYGALGLPAVYSNVTPYRESVRDGETGLLADNTADAWRAALRRLVVDADLRAAVGRNARRHVFARRTLRRTARRWVATLRGLAGRRATTSRGPAADAPVIRGKARPTAPDVLVVVPGSVNYFYDRAGHRIAEAARSLGLTTAVETLQAAERREGGCVLVVNPLEVVEGLPAKAEGLDRLRALAGRHDRVAAVTLECARTHWFTDLAAFCERAGVDHIIDLGLVNQYDAVAADVRPRYRFAVNGLTASERRLARRRPRPGGRPIPWAFIGHHSTRRAEVVGRLLTDVSPGGLVYLPSLSPVAAGGPHIGERAYLNILRRADAQVWCSHHDLFYLESERFRMSLLAGCVPVKALLHAPPAGALQPFHHFLPPADGLADFLRSLDPAAAWARFEDEFLALPPLEAGVAEALAGLGAAPAAATADVRVNGAGPGHGGANGVARPRAKGVGR